MQKLIENFPAQVQKAVEIASTAEINLHAGNIENIVVSGLGGSGIGGQVVQELQAQQLKVPFFVSRDYTLPNYVNKNSLVIISSYSGNTEETIAAFADAVHKGAQIACVTSGGKVLEQAQHLHLPLIKIPGGDPPRACMGYSVVSQLFILSKAGMIDDQQEALQKAAHWLEEQQEQIKSSAKAVAEKIWDKIPVIYTINNCEAVAIRCLQQFNENSKMLAWHHVIPEMNHNEIVPWKYDQPNIAALFLRFSHEHPRKLQRIEFLKNKIAGAAAEAEEIWAKGDTLLEEYLYMIHFVDWLSLFAAYKKGVDPMDIALIDELKEQLAN